MTRRFWQLVSLFTLTFLLGTMIERQTITHRPGECYVQHEQVRCVKVPS